ncbi:MAG: hypothetical protein ACLT47_05855 [Sutterella wadsworthensis]
MLEREAVGLRTIELGGSGAGNLADSGGFRTYMAQLSCLGFFWKDRKAKAYGTTRAGEALIEAKAPGSVLRCQLLRMQYPSVSGGKEWLLLEKAMTSVMIRLGFDESEHIGQKKAPRDGGYPDIRVKASTMQTCGFADTKATSRYGMDTNDTNKLSLYYKDCWAEFPDQAPSSFFMYIAGGFDGKDAASVLNTLERCTQKYGRPVCAITVNAMLRLVRMNNRPGPEALVRAFSQRAYYRSVESIIQASAP